MWLSIAGGFMGIIIRFSQLALNRYQNFTIDKSLIKKLYTKRQKPSKKDLANEEYSDANLTAEQREVKTSIKFKSEITNYYFSSTWQRIKWLFYQVFCLKKCYGPRYKFPNREKEFLAAEAMLLQEIDLLDIIQQLRTAKLVSSVLLTNN